MRTTNINTTKSMLNYMTAQEAQFNKLTQQASSGVKVSTLSDNAQAARNILNTNTQLSQIQGYMDNIAAAQQQLNMQDDVLASLSDMINKVSDLATQAANGTYSQENLAGIKTQVDSILESVIGIANTDYNGNYMFSGAKLSVKTYDVTRDADGNITAITYNGTPKTSDYEQKATVSDGISMTINTTGDVIFGSYDAADPSKSSGLFDTLVNLSNSLKTNDTAAISGSLKGLDNAFNTCLSVRTNFATVANQMDITKNKLDNTQLTLKEYRSSLRDTDLAQTLTELVSAQTALEATYSLSSSLLSKVSLLDYI
ncbi:MAG: flagellar hook-associated protein FlgL [bacterium]|nr:flagellar hook-associated protein FlgL [bacterium]